MKLLLFGDLHAQKRNDEELTTINRTLLWVADKIRKEKPDITVFMGDLFHSPYAIESPVLNVVAKGMLRIAQQSKLLIVLMGNHDYYMQKGDEDPISNLGWLNGYPKTQLVVDEVHEMVPFVFAPYFRDAKAFIDATRQPIENKYLFCHQDIQGLRYNKFAVDTEGINAKEDLKQYKHIFVGHYHLGQEIKTKQQTICAVGAIQHFNFATDINGEAPPCLMLVHVNKSKNGKWKVEGVTREANPYSFYYYTTNSINPDPSKFATGCQVEKKRTNLRLRLSPQESLQINPEELKDWKRYEVQLTKPKDAARSTENSIQWSDSTPDLIKKYVTLTNPDAENADSLIALGVDIFEQGGKNGE